MYVHDPCIWVYFDGSCVSHDDQMDRTTIPPGWYGSNQVTPFPFGSSGYRWLLTCAINPATGQSDLLLKAQYAFWNHPLYGCPTFAYSEGWLSSFVCDPLSLVFSMQPVCGMARARNVTIDLIP